MLRKTCLLNIAFLGFLAISGCTQANWVSLNDNATRDTPLSQPSSSSLTCQVVELQDSAKDAALQQALADPQVQWLIAQMEERGLLSDLKAVQAFQAGRAYLQVIIFFKPHGHLVWWRQESGETFAKAIISQKQKWEILDPYDEWQRFRSVAITELKEILKGLHKNKEFQKTNKDFEDKGYKLAEEKARGILNETKGEYLLWLRWQKQEMEGSAPRAIPLLIDDGYSTGGGGTDIAVIYDPTTGKLILWVVPPELVRFLECFVDCLIDNYGPIALEIILIVILIFDDCVESCTWCARAPSFEPGMLGMCRVPSVRAGSSSRWGLRNLSLCLSV